MKHSPLLAIWVLLVGMMTALGASAAEPREITWDDLVPPEAEFDDPFTKLNDWQIYDLTMVAQVRDRQAANEEIDERTLRDHKKRVKKLEGQGVDIDYLISIREEVAEERVAKTYMANQELDGKTVKIPGYLLPLEFEGDKVTEFFLVPFVGACIHTPPPPPNQIVHVATEGYVTDGGLYMPVWVSGTMKSEQSSSNLSLVDGNSDIPSSYALDAIKIQPYE